MNRTILLTLPALLFACSSPSSEQPPAEPPLCHKDASSAAVEAGVGADASDASADAEAAWEATKTCPSHRYKLAIDDNFTPTQFEAIVAAMNDWVVASQGKIVLDGVYTRADHGFDLVPCTIRVQRHNHPDPRDMGYTIEWLEADKRTASARTWIREDTLDPAAFRAVVLHELGHVVGLDHTGKDDPNSCMWPYITQGCEITCPTKRSLCAIWGCQADCDGG